MTILSNSLNRKILTFAYGLRPSRDIVPIHPIRWKGVRKLTFRITGLSWRAGGDIVVVHGAGHVEVDVNGETINIVTVHTYPHKYSYLAEDRKASAASNGGDVFRAAEMKYICDQTILKQDPEGTGNWMMVGDFNAVSRVDNWHLGRPEDDKAFLLNDYVRSQTPYVDLIEK